VDNSQQALETRLFSSDAGLFSSDVGLVAGVFSPTIC
jgi:hypothetical protein